MRGQHVHCLVDFTLGQFAAGNEIGGGETFLFAASEQDLHGHRFTSLEDGAMEKGVQNRAGAASALVAA